MKYGKTFTDEQKNRLLSSITENNQAYSFLARKCNIHPYVVKDILLELKEEKKIWVETIPCGRLISIKVRLRDNEQI